MSRMVMMGVVFVAGVVASLGSVASVVTLAANLTPGQEVNGSTSTGFGVGAFSLDTDTLEFAWNINFTALEGDVTKAHFHGAPVGQNGGVVFGLVDPADADITGDINDLSPNGSLSGFGILTAQESQNIRAGLWYINIHTAANPGGAIRGQVFNAQAGSFNPVPLPAGVWLMLSAVGGLALVRRRAKVG